LATETNHSELAAWCLEIRAWDALTEGQYRAAPDKSKAAQDIAPRDGSGFIQATAQQDRAWARLGDARAERDALLRVERITLPAGEEPVDGLESAMHSRYT